MSAIEAKSRPFSADQMLERISSNRWLPLAVNLAAFVLLAYGLARWTWRLLEPATSSAPTISQPLDTNRYTTLEIQNLLGANIFGQVQNTSGTAVNPERLPLSSLNLVLTGVMARGALSFALFSVNGAAETPILIGQEITAGATLESVYPDRAILRRGGTLESVLLKDTDATLPAGSIVPTGTGQSSPGNNVVRSLGGGNFSVDRQGLTQNLTPETLSQATVAPSAGGLVVRDVQSGSVFEKLGLRAGDVVRNINGQSVTNLEDVMKAYSQFASSTQAAPIAVEVSRGGKTEVLQYRMQ